MATITTTVQKDFQTIWSEALEKARQAYTEYADKHYQTPNYVVTQRANPLDDKSPVLQAWPLTDLCGFVWLDIDGRSPFWRWMKKTGKCGDTPISRDASPHYVKIPLGVGNGGNGDITAQEKAYAAFADHVKQTTGTEIYSNSRLD